MNHCRNDSDMTCTEIMLIEFPFIAENAARRTSLIAAWLVAGCLCCFCASTPAATPVPVRTQTLAESAIYPESAAPAVVVSLNDAPIAAQLDALVVDVPARVGDTVKAGAILVKLACKDFELEQSRLKAERQAIQARLNWRSGSSNSLKPWRRSKPCRKSRYRRNARNWRCYAANPKCRPRYPAAKSMSCVGPSR